jgi:hypothetical protein
LRIGHGAKNMAVVRHFGLYLVREGADRRAIKRRRECAAMDGNTGAGGALTSNSLPWAKSDDPPHKIISTLYANLLDEDTIDYLRRREWQGEIGRAEAIIGAVNNLVRRPPAVG